MGTFFWKWWGIHGICFLFSGMVYFHKRLLLIFIMTHVFHLVTRSDTPLLVSCLLLMNAIHALGWLHGYFIGLEWILPLLAMILTVVCWFRDIHRESSYFGCHSTRVVRGLHVGFYFFIVSEIMLFGTFLGSYFYFSASPGVVLGENWPFTIDCGPSMLGLPILGTMLLITSSVLVTVASSSYWRWSSLWLWLFSAFLGMVFISLQAYEYVTVDVLFTDAVYGSLFFIITGLHGLHVFIGLVWLMWSWVSSVRGYSNSGWILSGVYWHFVDYVWLVVLVTLY